ncbi:MAG: AMP-binding protein [Bacteroidales bacterium]|nr:AMP-binding protein [Bacteroidales bacterium]
MTRIILFCEENKECFLLITAHNIVCDRASVPILQDSFLAFYQQLSTGNIIDVSPKVSTYEEFFDREKDLLQSNDIKAHAAYWQQLLEGELPVFELNAKLHGPLSPVYRGATLSGALPEKLFNWLQDYSRSHSLQPQVVLLAVFKLLLHKYSNQEDIIVGVTFDNRVEQQLTDEIGCFANTLPVRTQLEEGQKFEDHLLKVNSSVTDALKHAVYPLFRALEQRNVNPSDKNTIFSVTFCYQNRTHKTGSLFERQTPEIEVIQGIHQTGDSDLGLEVIEDQTSFIFNFTYNADIYSPATIYRIKNGYNVLLSEISRDPNGLAQAYPIITDEDKHKVLIDFNDTTFDYPKDKCIHELFAENAILNPNHTAVTFENERLSYQQLYNKCYDLALYLQSLGVKPDSHVGLCMERSNEMMASIQAILMAGGAYVPMDPDYPDDRLSYMLEDSQASMVICQGRFYDKLTSLMPAKTKLIILDDHWKEIAAQVKELKSQQATLRKKLGRITWRILFIPLALPVTQRELW